MRTSKSRSRGKSRNNNNNNSSSRPTGGSIVNRVFDSSGPDSKVRGTPQQIIDKYNQLHRDAQLSHDRVAAENFAQHAEHYTRMLAEATREMDTKREEQEEQNRQRQIERDRERSERLKVQEAAASEPATMEQPSGSDGQSDLVETPEAAQQQDAPAPAPRRPRKPRPPRSEQAEKSEHADKPERGDNSDGGNSNDGRGSAPEAAE